MQSIETPYLKWHHAFVINFYPINCCCNVYNLLRITARKTTPWSHFEPTYWKVWKHFWLVSFSFQPPIVDRSWKIGRILTSIPIQALAKVRKMSPILYSEDKDNFMTVLWVFKALARFRNYWTRFHHYVGFAGLFRHYHLCLKVLLDENLSF